MVLNEPSVLVTSYPGLSLAIPNTEQIWAICVESTKGEPFEPTFVQTPNQAYQEFKTRVDGFWGVGGQGLYMIRVTAGTPVAAVHKLFDNATTSVEALNLTAKQKGSYKITITAGANVSGGSNLTISEDGMPTEYYLGVDTIAELVARINSDSNIVDATFVAEGSGVLGTITATVLGTGFTVGSDGTVDPAGEGGALALADAPEAHRLGLAQLENYVIKGVFSMSPYSAVQDEYMVHATAMSRPEGHRWRYAAVGATPDDGSKSSIIARAEDYNDEHVLFVGQGLIDRDGNEHQPYEATAAVAGKRSYLTYGNAIWGGQRSKLLGIKEEQFFVDVMPMVDAETFTTAADFRDYNEKGVITFTLNPDGVRIREGVTTVQSDNELMEDEEAVVSIVDHAKQVIYDACFEMLGKNITSSFKTDIEENIKSALERMKNEDQTLVDIPDEPLKAYQVSATIVPRSNQRLGKVMVDASITPVHAAREIKANVVVL